MRASRRLECLRCFYNFGQNNFGESKVNNKIQEIRLKKVLLTFITAPKLLDVRCRLIRRHDRVSIMNHIL